MHSDNLVINYSSSPYSFPPLDKMIAKSQPFSNFDTHPFTSSASKDRPSSSSSFPSSNQEVPLQGEEEVPELDMSQVLMDGILDVPNFNDIFNFEEFESSNDSHSATTISPNQTPSPIIAPHSPIAFTSAMDYINHAGDDFQFDFTDGSLEEKPYNENKGLAGPSSMTFQTPMNVADIKVKEEPIENNWKAVSTFNLDSTEKQTGFNTAAQQSQNLPSSLPPAQQQSQPQGGYSSPLPDFTALPMDQQLALQQLMINIMTYQQKFGFEGNVEQQVNMGGQQQQQQGMGMLQPTTIQPSQIFSTSPTNMGTNSSLSSFVSPSNPSGSNSSQMTPAIPIVQPAPTVVKAAGPPSTGSRRLSSSMYEDDDEEEELKSIESHGQPRGRSNSTFSFLGGGSGSGDGNDDLDEKLDKLAPLSSIFATGKGKGGKKGGGMSSVVRGEDEEIDDDDSWRPSPEEYKKLSSKEKRQLRNKLSARAFRNRRKDYIGTLEGHIRERDGVIDSMRNELLSFRSENQDLRRELEAMKASTMNILHPESANKMSEPPAFMSALSMPSTSTTTTSNITATASTKKASVTLAPTPVFNPKKDLPNSSSILDSKTKWGNDMFGLGSNGSTICHTILTPEKTPDPASSTPSSASTSASASPIKTSLKSSQIPFTLPRVNLNPMLVERDRTNTINLQSSSSSSSQGGQKDILGNSTFAEWTENNAFSLKSMDSYRMQMWSRLAREAQNDKIGLESHLRPKFFVDPITSTSSANAMGDFSTFGATAVGMASGHITNKLVNSFWSAFQSSGSSNGKLDTDKLTAVVTGKARLKVIDNEKNEWDNEDELINALGSLRLQAGRNIGSLGGLGGRSSGQQQRDLGVSAREDPLRAIAGGFMRMAIGVPGRA